MKARLKALTRAEFFCFFFPWLSTSGSQVVIKTSSSLRDKYCHFIGIYKITLFLTIKTLYPAFNFFNVGSSFDIRNTLVDNCFQIEKKVLTFFGENLNIPVIVTFDPENFSD